MARLTATKQVIRHFARSPITIAASLIIGATLIAAVFANVIAGDPNFTTISDRLLGLGTDGHFLGTDLLGRDTWARLVHGARLAWVVGSIVSISSVLLGGLMGALAGFYGGRLDTIVSRVIDSILAFPGLLLALVLVAIMGASTKTAIIALAIVYSPLAGRVVRASVLEERELDYVRASRGLGNRDLVTLMRHVIPNVVGPVLVVATVVMSRSILVEASLSFLGVGTQPPTASWGLMAAEGREFLLVHPHLVLLPGILLSLTGIAINLAADAMGDFLDARKTVGTVEAVHR